MISGKSTGCVPDFLSKLLRFNNHRPFLSLIYYTMNISNKVARLTLVVSWLSVATFAQSFNAPFDSFSGKKTAYLTLEDGSKLEGTIDDIDRKKGLIEEITLKDAASGKKRKLTPEQVKSMYLPPSGFSKLSTATDQAMTASKWDNTEIQSDLMKDGYAYFEKISVVVGKKTLPMLMQLINPGFSSKVRVYHDPMATETGGIALGGIQMTGGDDKSYYVKKGDKPAMRVKKKNYDDEFKNIFSDCPAFLEKNQKGERWKHFEMHVFTYTQECK